MSNPLIRNAKHEDLQEISLLIEKVFRIKISMKYLQWIISDPYDTGQLNSIVALNNNKIIAHVGYIKSRYYLDGKELIGTHAILLCVLPKYRGEIGKLIFQRVSSIGDISIIYEGTESAQRIYPKAGFYKLGNIFSYRTSLKLPQPTGLFFNKKFPTYIRNLSSSILDVLMRCHKTVKIDPLINLKPYNHEIKSSHQLLFHNVLSNYPDKEIIDWLIKCNFLDSHIFTVHKNKKMFGILFLYIKKYKTYSMGRINHLPNIGDNINDWLSLLIEIEIIFRNLNCSTFSVYSTHPTLIKALNILGYRNVRTRAIWAFDNDDYLKEKTYHLTYLEGDHGFRNL